MASIDVAKLLNKITQDIPGINTVLKALANWDVSALSDVPDGAMQATTDANNNLTIKKKVSGSYTPVAKLMHDVDKLDGYHASTSATANAIAVRNASGVLPGNILGNSATADTATALATGSVVPVNQGGTGATTASQARANLGVAAGEDFTTHIAKQASPSVEGHVKLDALAADGSNMAAPGGYGLGKTVGRNTGTTLNNLLEGGFYSLVSSPNTAITDVAFPNIGNGTMLVVPRGNETIQLFFCSEGWVYRRYTQTTATWGDFRNIPNGITDSTSTTSSTIAASATAVKTAFDRAKQVATASITGGVKVGGAISSVSSDGTVTLSSATTTALGIGRVATSADLVDGATITNGPAFLAAGSGAVTPTPTPNTIMCRDNAGRVQAEDPVHDKDVANKTYVDNSLIWVVTGSITLNGTTNNTVVMTGIVTELSLEVGDVIRIDTGAYNKLHTVESITNNGSIIVNYEHAGNRRNGSLKLPNFTGTATVTRIAKWFNAPIGLGQAWLDVVSSRAAQTNYTNTTCRAIFVHFLFPVGSGIAVLVDGVQVGASSGGAGTSNYAIVPSGGVYRVNGNVTMTCWAEIR